MSRISFFDGNLPPDDLRRAFVMGAKWWEFLKSGATMWQSDQRLAEEKAEEIFPNGKPPLSYVGTTHLVFEPCADERHDYYRLFLSYIHCPYCGEKIRNP